MKFLRRLAIILFDLLDRYLHQSRISNFIRKENINLDYCIDVGAHSGFYTDLILKLNKDAKILLFEPQLKYFRKIKKKYKGNKNIKIYREALSNKNTKKTLFINKHDLTTSLAVNINNNFYFKLKAKLFNTSVKGMVENKIKIKTIRLDSVLKKNRSNKINLIKIDTEGHEFEVIKGLGNKIKSAKYLIVEFHPKETYSNYSPENIHKYLRNKKFVLKKIYKFPLTTFEDRIYKNNLID